MINGWVAGIVAKFYHVHPLYATGVAGPETIGEHEKQESSRGTFP
jgi:hypothetical protein